MKLSMKFAICMILMITIVLSLGGYLFLRQDFNASLSRQSLAAYRQHDQQVTQLQAAIYKAVPQSESEFRSALYLYGSEQGRYSDYTRLAIYSGGTLLCGNLDGDLRSEALTELTTAAKDNGSATSLIRRGNNYYDLFCTRIEYGDSSALVVTAHDLTDVYAHREPQIRWYLQIEAAAICGAVLAAIAVGLLLTLPLQKLNKAASAIAGGDYSIRTAVKSHDEIGELSRSFDTMAEAVENQIEALNLSVTQRDDFISAFTHEIKTPMTGIIGYSDILRESTPDPATLHAAADAIYHDARRLEALSQKLLLLMGLNREDELELLPVPLERVFREAKIALGSPAQVRWAACPGVVVLGDFTLLTDMLQNLAQNALRSLDGDGMVLVEASSRGGTVTVSVTDNGCGIPADKLERITEPFYMVDKSRARRMNGSGVGLALCARIARLHSTELHFESAVGVGTRCTFTLEVPHENT